MMVETNPASEFGSPDIQNPGGWRGVLRQTENLTVAVCLAVMMLLPLAEITSRKVFNTGISGSIYLVQHLTLMVGMLGGAIAAREGRLLALSTATTFLQGPWKSGALIFSHGFAAAITLFLGAASVQFVATTKATGKILAYGIPIWIVQVVFPIGFTLIALRLLRHASNQWRGRAAALALAAAVVALGTWAPVAPGKLMVPALAALLVATALGAPIFTTLGGAALILFWGHEESVTAIPLKHYALVTNPTLPSVPLFTLTGYFLARGGASTRLVRVFQSLVGSVRGGPAIMLALVCAFFTSFTGASGVTILALGGLLMPILLQAGYTEKNALGLLTGSGSLGLLFPPCLPLILYAIIANTSAKANVTIEQMFLAGLGPGMLLVAMTALLGIQQGPRLAADRPPFDPREIGRAMGAAKWELLVPVVALTAMFSGFATPVEAAAVTAVYAFVVETFVYRDLRLTKDVPQVMVECGLLVGGVLLILGVALGFTNFLVNAQVPDHAVEWATATIQSKWLFLLMLNVFLLLVGCVMDIFSAMVVVVPLIVPLGLAFGVDPVHLGIIFLANLELGYLSPLVGINTLLASYRFGKPVLEVSRAVIPMQLVLLTGVLLITYLPPLTTTLPRLLK